MWDVHMKVSEKGKACIGKLHPILVGRCKTKNVIIPPLEYEGDIWEGNQKVMKQLEVI